VDKNKLLKLAVGGQGKPATSLVASAFGVYDPNVQKYPYDFAKAKSLLQAAGADKGFSLDYISISGPEFDLVAQSVQEDLSKLNITMKITSVPVAQWAAAVQKQKPAMAFIYYTYSDPDVVLLLAQTGQPFEWTYHGDTTLDGWLSAQRVTFDPAKRRAIFYQIQERINKNAYYLYLWEGNYSVAAQNKVKNTHIDLVGFIHAQEMTLA
jgi:peptide/nickel transport system substrate-binding protein